MGNCWISSHNSQLSDQSMKKWEIIKMDCIKQSHAFIKWDARKSYDTFHSSHYDWWAFPYDQPSSYRDKYQIGPVEKEQLIHDKQFIEALRTNAILVCRAWGFNLEAGKSIPLTDRTGDQQWTHWPIRLYKMSNSLELFEQHDLHVNSVRYGLGLIRRGERFIYSGKDLEGYYVRFAETTGRCDLI